MPRELAPHGTVAAYRRHRRSGEDPCDICKAARRGAQVGVHAALVAEGGQRIAVIRERGRARQRALNRLKRNHKSEFDRAYAEELRKVRKEQGNAI